MSAADAAVVYGACLAALLTGRVVRAALLVWAERRGGTPAAEPKDAMLETVRAVIKAQRAQDAQRIKRTIL